MAGPTLGQVCGDRSGGFRYLDLSPGYRRQTGQYAEKPDRIDAGGGQAREITFRIRVERRINQWIAIKREIEYRTCNPRSCPGVTCGGRVEFGTWLRFFTKEKSGSLGSRSRRANVSLTKAAISAADAASRPARSRSAAPPWAQLAKFVEKEIVLPQCKRHLLGRPSQQSQQLIVRQKMPVPSDDGKAGPAEFVPRSRALIPIPCSRLRSPDIFRLRPHHGGDSFQRHQWPVSPDERCRRLGNQDTSSGTGADPMGRAAEDSKPARRTGASGQSPGPQLGRSGSCGKHL